MKRLVVGNRQKPIKPIGKARQTRKPKRTYLIVCEGKKTEPNYFTEMRQHHQLSISIEVVGTGYNTITLVEEAERLKKEKRNVYDQIWCVFDKDDFPEANFTNAIAKAKAKGFKLAWSNECFELWYLLHFTYTTAHLPRKKIFSELETHLGKEYDKNLQGIYASLLSNQQTAITNAEKLEKTQLSDGKTPTKGNPWTLVHHLIKELLSQAVS